MLLSSESSSQLQKPSLWQWAGGHQGSPRQHVALRQPFGCCWANRGRNSSMSALSETPEMASSHCSFGSNPPRKLLWSGEIILPSHCMCSATIPDVGLSQAMWMARGGHRDLRAGTREDPTCSHPHPREWGLPGAWNREKVSPHPCHWPLQAPSSTAGLSLLAEAGSKPLTLELTEFMEGDGYDCSRDLSSVAWRSQSSLLQEEQMFIGTIGEAEGQAQGSCRVVQWESSVSQSQLQQGQLTLANT